jgi:hypothetical protein
LGLHPNCSLQKLLDLQLIVGYKKIIMMAKMNNWCWWRVIAVS